MNSALQGRSACSLARSCGSFRLGLMKPQTMRTCGHRSEPAPNVRCLPRTRTAWWERLAQVLTGTFLFISVATSSFGTDLDWPVVGGDRGSSRYSQLNQINRTNVDRLEVAWTYHTGDSG